ncbi:MAG: hypothetical protein MHM6MM_008222 [Cercozoa sp. M6MM]
MNWAAYLARLDQGAVESGDAVLSTLALADFDAPVAHDVRIKCLSHALSSVALEGDNWARAYVTLTLFSRVAFLEALLTSARKLLGKEEAEEQHTRRPMCAAETLSMRADKVAALLKDMPFDASGVQHCIDPETARFWSSRLVFVLRVLQQAEDAHCPLRRCFGDLELSQEDLAENLSSLSVRLLAEEKDTTAAAAADKALQGQDQEDQEDENREDFDAASMFTIDTGKSGNVEVDTLDDEKRQELVDNIIASDSEDEIDMVEAGTKRARE